MALTAGLLGGIERLDPLPITAQRLVKALDDERIGPAQIADYVEYDPAVAVWDRCFLVAQVLSRYDFEEREFKATLHEIPPPTGGA